MHLAELFNQGRNMAGNGGRHRLAASLYRAATKVCLLPGVTLGITLVCKRKIEAISNCLKFNAQAVLLHPEDQASWWNLGIAATALRDWPEARRAWAGCGIS